jgi:hypothetical protein
MNDEVRYERELPPTRGPFIAGGLVGLCKQNGIDAKVVYHADQKKVVITMAASEAEKQAWVMPPGSSREQQMVFKDYLLQTQFQPSIVENTAANVQESTNDPAALQYFKKTCESAVEAQKWQEIIAEKMRTYGLEGDVTWRGKSVHVCLTSTAAERVIITPTGELPFAKYLQAPAQNFTFSAKPPIGISFEGGNGAAV